MTVEPIPETPLSLPVAIIGGGMVAAFVGTFVFYPVIDRYVRDRFRLSRGQAMALLLACALFTGLVGSGVTYLMFRDDPRYQPPEENGAALNTSAAEIQLAGKK